MGLYDQHLHSWNSFDCKTPPIDNIHQALQRGLAGLTFTEHFDTHPTEWPGCIYDDRKIAAEIDALRAEFGDRLFIGKGIEVCYQPAQMDRILETLNKGKFDLVILSVHWAHDRPVHVRGSFPGMDVQQYIGACLEAVRDATAHLIELKRRGHQPFHVLGHMDFARRYAHGFFGHDGPLTQMDLVDEILTNCLNADIIPEVNTSTLRNGMSAPMPGPEVMKRYAELGGRMMSLGSDAHSARCIGADFDRAINMLRSAGIREQAVFKSGRLLPLPL